MNQLATLHLSKSPKTNSLGSKPSLSQLASMNVTKTVSSTNQPKLNLAELAKLNLNNPNANRSKINSSRPSLSDLAKINLKSKVPLENPISDAQPKANHLNLASALRSKCTIADKRAIPTLKDRKNNPEKILYTPISAPAEQVDPALVLKKASRLGRVVTKPTKRSSTVFLKFDLPSLLKQQTTTIAPFIFDTPSPDDVIQRRLGTVKKE